MRITPLLGFPLPPVHGRSPDPPPLSLPGASAPVAGHAGFGLATLGGFGFFGFGVVVTGLGVAWGVARGVGAGVARGVGAGVGAAVGGATGPAVGAAVGPEVTTGDPVEAGTGETAGGDGSTLGTGDGLASIDGEGPGSIDGVGVSVTELAVGWGSAVDPPGVDVGAPVSAVVVGSPDGAGVGVAITAIGPRDAAARCCSSTPPIPSAIVARKRFRTPRLRMSRTR